MNGNGSTRSPTLNFAQTSVECRWFTFSFASPPFLTVFHPHQQMGLVHITSLYLHFNGSHFGLPSSEIPRMTGLAGKIVWTMTYSHRPHCFSRQEWFICVMLFVHCRWAHRFNFLASLYKKILLMLWVHAAFLRFSSLSTAEETHSTECQSFQEVSGGEMDARSLQNLNKALFLWLGWTT